MSGWKVESGSLQIGRTRLRVHSPEADENAPKTAYLVYEEVIDTVGQGQQAMAQRMKLPSYACAVEVANVIAKHLGKRK